MPNPNWSLKLVLCLEEIIKNSFSNISTTLTNDFITSHFVSQSPQISSSGDPILTTQSYLKTSCCIQYMNFCNIVAREDITNLYISSHLIYPRILLHFLRVGQLISLLLCLQATWQPSVHRINIAMNNVRGCGGHDAHQIGYHARGLKLT